MHRILVAGPFAREGLDILARHARVRWCPAISPAELRRRIPDCQGLVVRSGVVVSRAVLEAGRRLRVIGRAGTGVDNIDVEAAAARGVLVFAAPGANAVATAEHTFALILSLVRRIPQACRSLKLGRWERGRFEGAELSGKTLGVVGLGRVGTGVAVRARAFEMTVLAFDPYASAGQAAMADARLVTLRELLVAADILTIHAPLTDETRGMIGAAELELMKRGAWLVNCARGGIVDEEALCAALKSGRLAGAGLDVFREEPPGPSPLLELENVVATPHLGSGTAEAQRRCAVAVAEAMVSILAGRPAGSAVEIVAPRACWRAAP